MPFIIKNTLMDKAWHRNHHYIYIRKAFGEKWVSDMRPWDCKYCVQHSWNLWTVDLCVCHRCRHIRSLEEEIFGERAEASLQEIERVIGASDV